MKRLSSLEPISLAFTLPTRLLPPSMPHRIKMVNTLPILFACLLAYSAAIETVEEECEQEEKLVEICAEEFLIFKNQTLAQTPSLLDSYCREYKGKEVCLTEHSKKCLSHSANQAITELIRTMSKQNRAICSNKNRKRLFVRTNQCFNKYNKANTCLDRFIERIHGIHQYSQENKIPVICCNYHLFLSCLSEQMEPCGNELKNALNRLVENYAGETLNYVCRVYRSGDKCSAALTSNTIDAANIKEEIPKSFFSLLVKIYLS